MNWRERENALRRARAAPWLHKLPIRVLTAMQNERFLNGRLIREDLRQLTPDEVRARGVAYWLRCPGLGRLGVAQLGQLIGGWGFRTWPPRSYP